ncbi:MAG: glycosyltransferase, partial [Candidatus Omnitrophota bacterium]
MNKLKEFYNKFRVFNLIRYKITPSMIEKKKAGLLFDDSEFYRLNLNCRGDAVYGYANIEDTRTKARVFVSSMERLPFSANSVKFIIADFETLSRDEKVLKNIFREWSRVMVPNAVLVLDNFYVNEYFEKLLKDAGFDLISDASGARLPIASFLLNPEIDFVDPGMTRIFSELRTMNSIVIESMLEYMRPKRAFDFLTGVYRDMGQDAAIKIIVKNEALEEKGKLLSFFDKANLCLMLNEIGFKIEKIELRDDKIEAVVRKKVFFPETLSNRKKICFIEQFLTLRYNHLGFDDDAMPRACEDLGLDYLLVEGMRNLSMGTIRNAMLSFRPTHLIFRLKELLPLIMYLKGDLKRMGTRVVFWFCDPGHPEKQDLGDIVDTMFLSNRGQVEEYKKAYNLSRVFYMPQGYDPYALHRVSLPEIHDVGFAGALSGDSLHDTRRALMEKLKKRYSVKIKNNVRNTIAEFYSQSKTVFGASDFDFELYTSNRFFIALGCAACYITKKFKGIELLAENKKHLLWFENEFELFDLLDYYLSRDAERDIIRQNA